MVTAALVERRVNDRKDADSGWITELTMRYCALEKETYYVYFPLEPSSLSFVVV